MQMQTGRVWPLKISVPKLKLKLFLDGRVGRGQGGVVVRQITVGTYLSQLRYHVRFWSSPSVKIKNEIKLK